MSVVKTVCGGLVVVNIDDHTFSFNVAEAEAFVLRLRSAIQAQKDFESYCWGVQEKIRNDAIKQHESEREAEFAASRAKAALSI